MKARVLVGLSAGLFLFTSQAAAQTAPDDDDEERAIAPAPCDPVTIFVDARGAATGTGTRKKPVSSLAAAARLAEARDACGVVVKLAPGTYEGNVEVTRPLAIHGERGAPAVIRGTIANVTGGALQLRDVDVVDAPSPGGIVVASPRAETRLVRVRVIGATGYGVRHTAGALRVRDVSVVGTRLVTSAALPCDEAYSLGPVPFEAYARANTTAILQSFVDAGPRGEVALRGRSVLCAPIVRDAFDQVSVGALFGHGDLPFSGLVGFLGTDPPIGADGGTGVYVSGEEQDEHSFHGLTVDGAARAGVIVSGAETSATFFNLTVTNTSHDPAFAGITVLDTIASGGSFGGLEARYGAKVQVVGGTFVGNDVAGVYLHEGATAPTLAGITISGSHAVTFSQGANMGDGLLVIQAGVGMLSASTSTSNARVGILLSGTPVAPASIGLHDVHVTHDDIGLAAQGSYVIAPTTWKAQVQFEANGKDVLLEGEMSVPNQPPAKPPPLPLPHLPAWLPAAKSAFLTGSAFSAGSVVALTPMVSATLPGGWFCRMIEPLEPGLTLFAAIRLPLPAPSSRTPARISAPVTVFGRLTPPLSPIDTTAPRKTPMPSAVVALSSVALSTNVAGPVLRITFWRMIPRAPPLTPSPMNRFASSVLPSTVMSTPAPWSQIPAPNCFSEFTPFCEALFWRMMPPAPVSARIPTRALPVTWLFSMRTSAAIADPGVAPAKIPSPATLPSVVSRAWF